MYVITRTVTWLNPRKPEVRYWDSSTARWSRNPHNASVYHSKEIAECVALVIDAQVWPVHILQGVT